MTLLPCTRAHLPEILAIFNDAILHSTALYEYQPRTPAFLEAWFDAKERAALPVLGSFTVDGALAGFATYGPFRAFPAFKYSVEHSVYVHPHHRGRGVGKSLLRELVTLAGNNQVHTLIGGIDSANTASIRLHAALGFTPCAHIRQAGFKFGRWLDLEFYQLLLPSPLHPVDG